MYRSELTMIHFRCPQCGESVLRSAVGLQEWGWSIGRTKFCSYKCMRKADAGARQREQIITKLEEKRYTTVQRRLMKGFCSNCGRRLPEDDYKWSNCIPCRAAVQRNRAKRRQQMLEQQRRSKECDTSTKTQP